MEYSVVGRAIPRVDAIEKVTGAAVYGEDIDFSKVLHGKVLRSPFAHAEIVNIDMEQAQRLPGIKAIVTGKDISVLGGEALKDYSFLAVEKLR
jgi:CO/xanthine dehydrogenase Mo-binding subunit